MNQIYPYWNLSLLLNCIFVILSKFCLSFWKAAESCQAAWITAWLWPSTFLLSFCKVSPASSSFSSAFPDLIYSVVHLKVPNGPKVSIVKTTFFHFFVSLAAGDLCILLCCSVRYGCVDSDSPLSPPRTFGHKLYYFGKCNLACLVQVILVSQHHLLLLWFFI